jgi:hypothetical protein
MLEKRPRVVLGAMAHDAGRRGILARAQRQGGVATAAGRPAEAGTAIGTTRPF